MARGRKRSLFGAQDYDKEIQDAVAVLAPFHFPISIWTEASVCRSTYIGPDRWLPPLKIVLSISDPDELGRTLEIGYFRGFWIDNSSCTPLQFYKFCKWLRSPDGMKARDDVYFQLRLKRKPNKVLSASEKKRTVRLHYEGSIAQLQKQIQKLQQEQEEEEEIKTMQDEEDKLNKELEEEILKEYVQEKIGIPLSYEESIAQLQKQIKDLQQQQEEEINKLQDEEDKLKLRGDMTSCLMHFSLLLIASSTFLFDFAY